VIMSIVSLALVILIFVIIMSEKKYLFDIGKELSSYLPIQLVDLILKRQKHEVIPIQKKFITICFSDIQGFTNLTDVTDPETSAEILNEYLTRMAHIAHKYNATVDKFLGDGIMIMFGAPVFMTPALQVDNAIKMAIEMQKEFKELNKSWSTYLNGISLHLRIGLHCGIATVGSFGPQERLSFTAIGKTVNIASRLEQMCKPDNILISYDIKQLAPNLPAKEALFINVKGIEKPIETYSIAAN
ncbi:MAG: adenylate/guanylate cyclase domain-containing protein, partial [Spirochaetota bacterium]